MCTKRKLLLNLLLAGVLFTSCGLFKLAPAPKVSFNLDDAEALAGREKGSARTASGERAATDNSGGSLLVKIMEDGTLESAMSCKVSDIFGFSKEDKERMTKWGKLTDVYLPPKDSNCSDVYLLFDEPTRFPIETSKFNVGYWNLSRLLCIHEDGTWTDLLYDSPMFNDYYPIDSNKYIQIAEDGTLFVLYRDSIYQQFFINKYDPATRSVSEICRFGKATPLVDGTEDWLEDEWKNNHVEVDKLRISQDIKWAYIQIYKAGKRYIHVVSIDDPSKSYDIVLDDTAGEQKTAAPCWDYDEKTNKLYYLQIERDQSDLSIITKQTVYKADCEGKNPEVFAELLASKDYQALSVMDNGAVWLKYEKINDYDDSDDFVIFEDVKNGNNIEFIEPKGVPYFYCGNNYVVKDDAIYSCYGGGNYNNQYNLYEKSLLFRVSVKDNTVIDYTDIIPEKINIMIISWSVGDTKLYITGESNGEPANYAINLDGSSYEKIAEGQVFTCIGSLK